MIKHERTLEDSDRCVDPLIQQPFVVAERPFTLDDLMGKREAATAEEQAKTCGDLQMEQCINLDLYLTPIMDDNVPKICTDELNTPNIMFDAEATNELNKIINNSTQHDGNPFNFPVVSVKEEKSGISQNNPTTALNNNNLNHNDKIIQNIIAEALRTKEINNSEMMVLANNMGSNNINAITATTEGSLLSSNDYALVDFDDINLDEYDLLADYNDAIMNDKLLSSVANDPLRTTTEVTLATPTVDHHNYALKLNFDASKFIFSEDIQTPDIINTICSIENEYNLIGQILTPEEIKIEATRSPETQQQPEEVQEHVLYHDDNSNISNTTTNSSAYEPKKVATSKRKRIDSDDEEYVPPTKSKRRRSRRKSTAVDDDDDTSDDDYVPYEVDKKPKRGRPSKPVVVAKEIVDSAHSSNIECSKYREMRDKNNEASRKSRRKRREQEMVHEHECDELSMKNERLRVEVSELEKTVNTFRKNLMQLLLNK